MCDKKLCRKCNTEKMLTEFSKRSDRKSGYQSVCKQCHHAYYKARYQEKPELYKKHRKNGKYRRRTLAQLHLREYLKDKKCVDCGESDPIVLTFDHVKGEKKFDISSAVSSGAYVWGKILEEIEKCVIRCCNCHQRKTAKDRGYYKLTKLE